MTRKINKFTTIEVLPPEFLKKGEAYKKVVIANQHNDMLDRFDSEESEHAFIKENLRNHVILPVLKEYEKGNLMRKAEIRGQYLKKKFYLKNISE